MRSFLVPIVILATTVTVGEAAASRPNVILIMTDDQGYGDLGLHGNPVVRTPQMDRIAREGVRLERFHVSPVCAPTRASLMTGRYNYRTRILDTYLGRAMMDPEEVTLAEMLAPAGYHTGIFGKWHLGDNYPMRPGDQGFQESLVLRGGGLGQPADHPDGGSYFSPVLFRNGNAVKTSGYCTDTFTDAALEFIESGGDRPFFAYIAYNCPHTPLEVPDSYLALYADRDLAPSRFPAFGQPIPPQTPALRDATARVYGMVTNIDDNLGRLLRRLDQLDLTRKTLVVFLTDNGPQQPRYVAGMRGLKGSVHDGGIRVPCFWRWPGTLEPGRVVDRIAAHIDVVPTLLDALGVAPPAGVTIDGRSLWPLLRGDEVEWPERNLFFQWHRGDTADLYRACAVRGPRYKLVQPAGTGPGPWDPAGVKLLLFDMSDDPYEERDIAATHPEVVDRLKQAYEAWYRDGTTERGFDPPRIGIDGVHEDPATLTRQDWRGPRANWGPRDLGYWEVTIAADRAWRITLRFSALRGDGTARLRLGGAEAELPLRSGATGCVFESVRLPVGPGRMELWLEDSEGTYGVHQADISLAPRTGG